FFEERDGRLYSRRMEAEKLKSETARRNGQKRGEQIRSANRSADGSADCLTQSQSQSQSQNQTPPPIKASAVDLELQKKSEFSQRDFDERDLRRFAEESRKLELKLANGCGTALSDDQILEYTAARIGRTPQYMRELFARIDGKASA